MRTRQLIGFLVLFVASQGCGGGGGSGGGAKSPDEPGASEGGGSEGGGSKSGDGNGGDGNGGSNVKLEAPAVGTKGLEKRSVSLDFELTLTKDKSAGGMQAGKWSIYEERSYEVLASGGDSVKKLRVIFGKREAKPLLGVEMTTATAGQTYTAGEKAEFARADGKDMSGDERDALSAEYDWVGGPAPLAKWVAGGELAAGKKVEGGSTEARLLLGVLQGVDYQSAKVTATSKGKSKSAGRDVIALDVKATFRLSSGPTHFDMDLSGPAKIDLATGWVTEMSLGGKAKASGQVKHKKGMLEVAGGGTAILERSCSVK